MGVIRLNKKDNMVKHLCHFTDIATYGLNWPRGRLNENPQQSIPHRTFMDGTD